LKLASRSPLAAVIVVAALLSFCSAASATIITVGPGFQGNAEWPSEECEYAACTFINDDLAVPGINVTSPSTGVVVGFNVIGGATAGTYRLSTIERAGEGVYIFRKRSAPVAVVPSEGVETYLTSLPITAGETIGLTMSDGASVGFLRGIGRYARWSSEPPESGPSLSDSSHPGIVGFNFEMQPVATIFGIGATSGPIAGGSVLTITGFNLGNATAVSFGDLPAASFSVQSETQLTAISPPNPAGGPVTVAVTTIAGKTTAPQQFTYLLPVHAQYCVVPNVKGKSLKVARKALAKASCKLGKVTKLGGATAKSGKVGRQGAKAGAKAVVGSKVAVTLKPPKVAHTKHRKGKH
jgi:hypothetical protein